MNARIEKDKHGTGLWMIIDGDDNTAWPITEEEVELVRNACNVWLEEKSQEIMKHNN